MPKPAPEQPAITPERRTRGDLIAVAVITALVLLAAALVWLTSSERATVSVTAAPGGNTSPAAARTVPDALAPLWSEPSAATDSPVVLGATVVTADGNAVVGRDFETGGQRWLYQRDVPLCRMIGAWETAVSVYRTADGCSEVTALQAETGARGAQRASGVDPDIALQANDTFVTAFGETRLESWRNDLVRTVEYGRVDAPVNPGHQPRSGCQLRSVATSPERVAILEKCPEESAERLTAMTPDPEDSTKPDIQGSLMLMRDGAPVDGARVLATTADRTAVLVPGSEGPGSEGPRAAATVLVLDALGATLAEAALPVEVSPQPPSPLAALGPAVANGPVLTFWTGDATVALNPATLEPLWTRPGTLGPGALMAGRLLLPAPGGIAVADPWTGLGERLIPVEREPFDGPVATAVAGTVVLEQRGGRVHALGS